MSLFFPNFFLVPFAVWCFISACMHKLKYIIKILKFISGTIPNEMRFTSSALHSKLNKVIHFVYDGRRL